jgi:putative hydroxymethylpyrimidine transport system substrate-binding protein
MKKSLLVVLSVLTVLSILVSGCQTATPAPAAEATKAPAAEATKAPEAAAATEAPAAEATKAPEAAATEAPAAASGDLKEITIVGDWPTPWVGWIPWLVAEEKGFYKEVGMKVSTVVPATVADPPKYVATGKADFAYTTQLDVILGRAAGIPIVSTAAVFRYNNWGIIFPKDSNIKELKDIKTISLYENTWDQSSFKAMMNFAGLDASKVNILPASSDTVPLLLAKKVDAIGGITNAEETETKVTGKIETSMLMAHDYGVPDVYVYVFASSEQYLKDNPEDAKKFMAATMKGLKYAVDNPDEALAIFEKIYPDALDKEYAKASWEATVPVLKADVYGVQDGELWSKVQKFMLENKLIDAETPVEQLYTNDYLPQ